MEKQKVTEHEDAMDNQTSVWVEELAHAAKTSSKFLLKQSKKKISLKIPVWFILVIILLCATSTAIVVHSLTPTEEVPEKEVTVETISEPVIITDHSLWEIINICELSAFEIQYEGIVPVFNDKKTEKIDCYARYEASIKAGIDFKNIKVEDIIISEDKKEIKITLPEIDITSASVDHDSLEFMFINEKSDTHELTKKALLLCQEDLKRESERQKNPALYDMAEKNVEQIVRALIQPFLNQLEEPYILMFE